MQYQEPDEDLINQKKQTLPIKSKQAGEITSAPPSVLESLDNLISEETSDEKIRRLLELKDIALRQERQQGQIEEVRQQSAYQRSAQDRKERTLTVASSITVTIGIGIMYTSSPLVGTFVLLLGLARLLRIPFNELYSEFFDFVEEIYGKLSSIFPPRS